MKGYAQIYQNKKIESNKKSNNNSSFNQSKGTLKSSDIIFHEPKVNTLPLNNNRITERNPSVITFSNYNNQDCTIEKINNNKLTEERYNENSLIDRLNISDKKDPIEIIGKNRIKYRVSNIEKENRENSLNFMDDNNNYSNNNSLKNNLIGKEKLKQKLKEKEKEKKMSEGKEKENEKIKDFENELLNCSSLNKNKEEKNQIKKDNNNINNKNNIVNNNKNQSKNNIDNNKNINYINVSDRDLNKKETKINNNKNKDIFFNEEISIRSEGSNNIVYETKYIKNYNNNVNNFQKEVNLVKESKEKILTKEEILYFTHIIFLNNASFIKSRNQYMMPKNNFLNILKSLNLISSQFILVEIDLIYNSIAPKSNMIIYLQFNQILMKIIQNLYPEKFKISPKLTINFFLNKLINHYNLYFENKIPKDYLYKYQYNSIVKLLQIIPDENQIFIINEIFITINQIYEKYFIFELNYNHDNIYKSGENLINFCRDFEIVPQIINSTQAMTYYNLSIHIFQEFNYFKNEIKKYRNFKNKGIIFTLIHFMIFFIHISLYSYTKIFGSKTYTYDENESIMTSEAKLVIFLEKLEHSKGMNNFIPKLSNPRTKGLSLLPSKEICSSLGIFDIYKKKTKENKYLDDAFFSEKEKQIPKEKEFLTE